MTGKYTLDQLIEYLEHIKQFVPTWGKTRKGFPRFSNYPKRKAPWFVDPKFVVIRNEFFADMAKTAGAGIRAWYIRNFTTIEEFLLRVQTKIDQTKQMQNERVQIKIDTRIDHLIKPKSEDDRE